MKNILQRISILTLVFISTLFIGCTDNFDQINKNPLAATSVNPSLLLPKMENFPFNGKGTYQLRNTLHSNIYAQYLATSANYFASGRYEFVNGWVKAGFWDLYYINMYKCLKEVKAVLDAHPEFNTKYQIMRILCTVGASRTTDAFGDIPYFNAVSGNPNSPYDSQKDIYYDLFKELDEAVSVLKNSSASESYGAEDIIYGGNIQQWIKFANSLRLRFALRISFIDPDKAKLEGEKALQLDLITSNDDNAGVHNVVSDDGHQLYAISYWNEFRASKTMIDIMLDYSSVQDPRLPLLFSQTQGYASGTSDVQYRGIPNGLPASELSKDEYKYINNSCIWGLSNYPQWNTNAKGSVGQGVRPSGFIERPLILFNYSEVCFLKAEAALRGWVGAGDAKTNYTEGIRASFSYSRLGVNASLYSTDNDEFYINGGNVAWDEALDFEAKLKKIITEKWIAIYPNGTEAWSEFRRTGYPDLTPVIQSDLSILPQGTFIKKLRYVDNELKMNKHATDSSLNGGKGDGQNVRVWWDTERYD